MQVLDERVDEKTCRFAVYV